MLTLRNFQKIVARCSEYELEDVICSVDDVDMFGPMPGAWFATRQRIVNRLWRHFSPVFAFLNPGLQKAQLDKNYDLFFVVCMRPWDLPYINSIKRWRQKCRIAVCWVDEIWAEEIIELKNLLAILSKFDFVITSCSGSVKGLEEQIQRPCYFMPPGIDAMLFSPIPNPPVRGIDVYNIGRRSHVTHQALLKMAEQNRIFYLYDTIHSGDMHPPKHRHHRRLVASIIKHSRYFIANSAKTDRPFETHGQSEMGFRFFEGAAAGTVMIGQPPDIPAFRENFDWPDAVIPIAYDEPNIAKILADLDSEPKRLAEIRKNNVIQSLLRHDWVYRWKDILHIAGLKPTPAIAAREKRLHEIANMTQFSGELVCSDTHRAARR
jgi:hypothetical protein